MLKYINNNNEWNLKVDYTNFSYYNTTYYKVNINGTITILHAFKDESYRFINEPILYICYIRSPVYLHQYGSQQYFKKCHNCRKQTQKFKIYDAQWNCYDYIIENYNLLFLCDECIEQAKTYEKINNIVINSQFLTKAVERENDVLFLYQKVIPIKYIIIHNNVCQLCNMKSKCNCISNINNLINKLFISHYLIYQLPLISDIQYYLYTILVITM
jgi:hypothetical protein